jgi:hypothetical protein
MPQGEATAPTATAQNSQSAGSQGQPTWARTMLHSLRHHEKLACSRKLRRTSWNRAVTPERPHRPSCQRQRHWNPQTQWRQQQPKQQVKQRGEDGASVALQAPEHSMTMYDMSNSAMHYTLAPNASQQSSIGHAGTAKSICIPDTACQGVGADTRRRRPHTTSDTVTGQAWVRPSKMQGGPDGEQGGGSRPQILPHDMCYEPQQGSQCWIHALNMAMGAKILTSQQVYHALSEELALATQADRASVQDFQHSGCTCGSAPSKAHLETPPSADTCTDT